MTEPPAEAVPFNLYKGVCLAALVVLTMCLLEKQMGLWAILAASAGMLGLLGPTPAGPVLLLGTLALAVPSHALGVDPPLLLFYLQQLTQPFSQGFPHNQRGDPLLDVTAAAAVLTYVAAHGRLLSVERRIFPRDLRKAVPQRGTEMPQRRTAAFVGPAEVVLLLAGLPVFCGLAALLLFWLTRTAPALTLVPASVRVPLLLLWTGACGLEVFTALLVYKSAASAAPKKVCSTCRISSGGRRAGNRAGWVAG